MIKQLLSSNSNFSPMHKHLVPDKLFVFLKVCHKYYYPHLLDSWQLTFS